jgi:TRAP-type mannitol/chloroaromatic compound transport system permease small subunit
MFEPEPLVRAFSKFMDTIGIKSAGGRVMLGIECFNGVFLLLALSLALTHDLIEFAVNSWRGVDHASNTGKYFLLVVFIMLISVFMVFVREMAVPSRDRSDNQ